MTKGGRKKRYFLNGSAIKALTLELNGSRKFLKNFRKVQKSSLREDTQKNKFFLSVVEPLRGEGGGGLTQ